MFSVLHRAANRLCRQWLIAVTAFALNQSARGQGIAEVLDTSQIDFQAVGNWFAVATDGADGGDHLLIGNNGAAELSTTVEGPGWVVYWGRKSGSGPGAVAGLL